MSGPCILSLNAGSSSMRLSAHEGPEGRTVAALRRESSGAENEKALADALGALADELGNEPRYEAVVHRIVHGGTRLVAPCRVDAAVEEAIAEASSLAPLHNPPALALLRAARRLLPHHAHFAVFDTGFYRDLPPAARHYALPVGLCEAHGIRRYGFHGIAHEAMLHAWREAPAHAAADARVGGRVISLQLGAGCSITASRDGRAMDTSMGFSPLEGLVMATRSGDTDPGVLLHLLRNGAFDAADLDELLNRRSGLLGLSGRSSSAGELLERRDDASALALDVYCHRITRYVGAFAAVLGGVDALLFGGGVGENVPAVRARALASLGFLGIGVDGARNDGCRGPAAPLRVDAGRVPVWVVPVDEGQVMARVATRLLAGKPRMDTGRSCAP